MAVFTFANNVQTTLAGPVTSGATTITLSSTAGLPATIPAGQYFAITLNDVATGSFFEIVYATNNLGSGQLQVLRGQEGTAARAWLANDKAYNCATAGVLASFLNAGATGNFVQLSPALRQTGNIQITGTINTNGQGQFGGGVSVGGALTTATTGSFSGAVTANNHVASKAYSNATIANLPFTMNASAGVTGLGPSSGLSTQGITASMLAIGNSTSGNLIAMDTAGNLAASGNLYAGGLVQAGGNVRGVNGLFTANVQAPTISQNGNVVVDTITSTGGTITVTRGGGSGTVNLEIAGGSQLAVGSVVPIDWGNGPGSVGFNIPGYGRWWVRIRWYINQGSNNDSSQTITLTGGTCTQIGTNGGITSQNATYYGVVAWDGICPNATAQALFFSLATSVGVSNHYWVVDIIRYA